MLVNSRTLACNEEHNMWFQWVLRSQEYVIKEVVLVDALAFFQATMKRLIVIRKGMGMNERPIARVTSVEKWILDFSDR